MNDENEKISITVADTRGSCTRIITDEYEVSDTCWPHLVEVFLEQLQGLGYKFFATPEEMVDVLEEYHQELMCAECGDCVDDEVVTHPDKSGKYPYTGSLVYDKDGGGKALVVVKFTAPKYGEVIYANSPDWRIGDVDSEWCEESFTKVSK